MRRGLGSIISDRSGVAAAEMALVTPLLVTLMFGTFELGKYFLDSHVVSKGVRDGARFAARQPFLEMPCGGTATDEADIRDIVRTGTTTDGAPPRLGYWTNPATITVTITCDSTAAYTTSGIYTTASGGARRVTVTAAVPYVTLFGFPFGAVNVHGRSDAGVMGI